MLEESAIDLMFISPFGPDVAFAFLPPGSQPAPPAGAAEEALLSPKAVDKRKNDFRQGRAAAHSALNLLGVPDAPILRGSRGEPLWPEGIVGSITHAAGAAAAAAGPARLFWGIGVDLEYVPEKDLSPVAARIALPQEAQWISQGGNKERCLRTILVFSAKETLFKAVYPSSAQFISFDEAALVPGSGGFTAELLRDALPCARKGDRFTVGWRKQGRFVLTYAALRK